MNTETKHTPKFTQFGRDIYHGETLVGRVNSRGQADLNPAGMALLTRDNEPALDMAKEIAQLKADKAELVAKLKQLSNGLSVSGRKFYDTENLIAKHVNA